MPTEGPTSGGAPTAESIASVYMEYAPEQIQGSVYIWLKRDVEAALAAVEARTWAAAAEIVDTAIRAKVAGLLVLATNLGARPGSELVVRGLRDEAGTLAEALDELLAALRARTPEAAGG